MIFNNEQQQQRLKTAGNIRQSGQNPYPHFLTKDMSIAQFKEKFGYVIDSETRKDESINASVAGRIKLLRSAGKAVFANIEDESGSIQIYFNKNSLGDEAFEFATHNIEVGDIVVVSGYAFCTKTGEFSLHASSIKLASKALSPLPEKFHGLTDTETRYRRRYLDMIMNAEVREDFKKRSIIVM